MLFFVCAGNDAATPGEVAPDGHVWGVLVHAACAHVVEACLAHAGSSKEDDLKGVIGRPDHCHFDIVFLSFEWQAR